MTEKHEARHKDPEPWGEHSLSSRPPPRHETEHKTEAERAALEEHRAQVAKAQEVEEKRVLEFHRAQVAKEEAEAKAKAVVVKPMTPEQRAKWVELMWAAAGGGIIKEPQGGFLVGGVHVSAAIAAQLEAEAKGEAA